eukprot:6463691-Amphidinium_carterae.1
MSAGQLTFAVAPLSGSRLPTASAGQRGQPAGTALRTACHCSQTNEHLRELGNVFCWLLILLNPSTSSAFSRDHVRCATPQPTATDASQSAGAAWMAVAAAGVTAAGKIASRRRSGRASRVARRAEGVVAGEKVSVPCRPQSAVRDMQHDVGTLVTSLVVGIDLGTTNSAVAAMEAGTPTVIPNAEGARTTPSVVAYSKTGELLVGQIAKRQAVVNPENTFYSVKRFVGRKADEVESELTEVSYTVESAGAKLQLDCPQLGKKFAPEEVSAQVLRKLSADAGKYLSAKVNKVC